MIWKFLKSSRSGSENNRNQGQRSRVILLLWFAGIREYRRPFILHLIGNDWKMARLMSCPTCGRVHRAGECPAGAARPGSDRIAAKIHHSNKWTRKAAYIKERDNYLCLACLYDLDHDGTRYTGDGLEVHHIIPIERNNELAFDDFNLITLCRYHHEQAEKRKYETMLLRDVVKRQYTCQDNCQDTPH